MARLPIVLAFVCLGPGAAFVCLVRMGDRISSWAIAFVLSLALGGAVASAMVWSGWWHAAGGYAVLAAPTVIIAALGLWPAFRRLWSWTSEPDPEPELGRHRRPDTIDWDSDLDWSGLRDGVTRPSPGDATTVLPRMTDAGPVSAETRFDDGHRSDATVMLARIPAQPADATARIPRIVEDDHTMVVPRIADDDHTVLVPRVCDDGEPVPAPRHAQPPEHDPAAGAFDDPPTPNRWYVVVGLALALAALATWLFSVSRSSLAGVGEYGLLPELHPAYYAAILLTTTGFVIELSRRGRRPWLLMLHIVVLILIMRATLPLLLPTPEYGWTYKHIGVVELIRTHGQITDGRDIYQQWPTLFAAVAQLVDATGIDLLRLATWVPVFFNLAFCVPLFALARTLVASPRLPYLTVFVFEAANWIGQDYLAPQPYAFTLALGSLLIVVRWLRRTATASGGRRPQWVSRAWARIAAGIAPAPYSSKYAGRAATIALSVVFGVVVAAHQITPYVVAMGAVALVALGLVQSFRVIPIVVGLAVGYLVPRYDVAGHYGLFTGFNLFKNAQPTSVPDAGSDGRIFNVNIALLLTLVIWGLAALAVVSSWRRIGQVAVPALLAFAPFGLLVAQSYGGEAIFRVVLFSSPWCALLIGMLVLRRRWLPGVVALPASAVALALLVVGSVQATHGPLSVYAFSRDEVAAAQHLYTHAEPGSDIVLVADNFPTRLTANYGAYYYGANSDHALVRVDDRLGLFELTDEGALTFDRRFDDRIASYLVFSPSMTTYLEYFGYMPADTVDTLKRQIDRSPRWQLFYRVGEVVIYRRAPGQAATPLDPG
jgi:hypothetical protein